MVAVSYDVEVLNHHAGLESNLKTGAETVLNTEDLVLVGSSVIGAELSLPLVDGRSEVSGATVNNLLEVSLSLSLGACIVVREALEGHINSCEQGLGRELVGTTVICYAGVAAVLHICTQRKKALSLLEVRDYRSLYDILGLGLLQSLGLGRRKDMINDRNVSERAGKLEMSKSPEEKNLTLELILHSLVHLYGIDILKHSVGIVDKRIPACPQSRELGGGVVDTVERRLRAGTDTVGVRINPYVVRAILREGEILIVLNSLKFGVNTEHTTFEVGRCSIEAFRRE